MPSLLKGGLLPTALAGLAVVVGASAAAGSGDPAPPASARTVTEQVSITPSAVKLPGIKVDLPTVSAPALPGDVIEVNGKRCPNDHPRKVGTSTSRSSTQVNGGPVRRKERHVLLCAR